MNINYKTNISTAAKKPTFVKKMSDSLVPEHGTVKLDCKVAGVPSPDMKV